MKSSTNNKLKKMSWINPTSHYVYEGWMHFFNEFYNFQMFDEAFTRVSAGKHIPISHYTGFSIFGTGFNFLNKKKEIYNATKGGAVIAGEFTTFDLALWYTFNKDALFYSEFFFRPYHEKLARKLLFYGVVAPFLHKKFIVPTKKAYDTFCTVTSRNKVLYFPPIYYNQTYNNKHLKDKTLRILMIGFVDDWKKNFSFFIEALSVGIKSGKLPNHSKQPIELHIVGDSRSGDLSAVLKAKELGINCIYHGKVDHTKLSKIYEKANLFVQPSLVDPIGAVVLEAMAHGLPLIASKNVGAADYSDNVGSIQVDPLSQEQFINALVEFSNPSRRHKAGTRNKQIIDENHAFSNKSLLKRRYTQLEGYLNQ